MVDILSIGGEPIFDERIVKIENHTYNPYANTTFGYSDEIRIPIQQQDLYTLPCESFLYVEGTFNFESATNQKETASPSGATLTNNCVAFMFDEIRYELDGVEIDKARNTGITSTLKNYATMTHKRKLRMENAGWNLESSKKSVFNFNFCVPLDALLGFCEDYKRVVINARHELILIRARNDYNSILVRDNSTFSKTEIILTKIQWRMPHVVLNDVNKLSLLRTLENGRFLSMAFRSWDLYEFPLLQSTTKHSWAVKAAAQLEKPRYVIFALQTGRKNKPSEDASVFDHCKLTNVKLYLNSEFYPYDDMNLDFNKGRFAVLYDMYAKFRKAYYGEESDETLLSVSAFTTHGPIVAIDCSHQNESIKSAAVDVRLEFECKDNVPPNTTAYCLIIHDRVVEYSPLTNIVRKIL